MQDLHKQYGPIVVLAPNMIAVSDPQAARHILVTEDWPKSNAIFSNSRLNPERPTLLAITEKKAYAVRKRLISSIFGLRYIRRLEPIMRDCIHVAMDQLHNACMQHGGEATVDIHHLMRALAVDIIGVTTFGESFHMVLHGSHPLPKKIEQKMLIAGILQFLPWLKYLPGFHDRDPYIDDFTRSIVERRRQIMKKEHRNDWLQKLLEAVDDSPNSAFQTSDLQDEVVHPGKLALLHEEIDRFYSNPAEETTADKALQMPYLQACIDETMRLYAAMAGGSPREAPKDVTLLGYHIPKGQDETTVLRVALRLSAGKYMVKVL
ncbi:hypothetical protein VTN31DRAFT_7058 [Thermomyces dupontii]|uniref:uncharacterized protein n=1 Tax=Talaromyces thermophilus TaxID=28565 RepID=UPI003742864E